MSNMADDCSRPEIYTVLNADQKHILSRYFDEGMITTCQSMQGLIEEAAKEANVDVDKVKKWIGNERRKRKAGTAPPENESKRKAPLKRATTGYNLFCSKIMNSDECHSLQSNSEKMKFCANKWKSLSNEEISKWNEAAKEMAMNNVTELTAKQKKQQISKTKKQLIAQLSYLESLGCEAAVLLLESDSRKIGQFGTQSGLDFLNQNETAIKFMEYFECPGKQKKCNAKDVAKMFNAKYREASGKPLVRVPYLHGGFQVSGLPDGVTFKKPTSYGSNTIQLIMNNADKIQFHLKSKSNHPDKQEKLSSNPKNATYCRILAKIIDKDKIKGCLSGEQIILEQDLEVADADLSASDFHVLNTDLNHIFEKDAMSALAANYQAGLRHKGYVLPVYTDTEEPYWLFYYPGCAAEIEALPPHEDVWGYWFDKSTSKLQFKLLKEKTSILALNIICSDDQFGSLRLKKNLDVCNGLVITVPTDFDASILRCLRDQGFL